MTYVVPPPAPIVTTPDAPSWIPTEVALDADYQRIAQLPRYDWEADPNLAHITWYYTNLLRLPGPPCDHCQGQWYSLDRRAPACPGCGRPTLKPVQAVFFHMLVHMRGVFASMRVGAGKTLCTLLGPVVVNSQRPGLVIQADLRDKTWSDIREAAKWWRVHPAFLAMATAKTSARADMRSVITYEQAQVKNGAVRLVQASWDCMMLDEFHNIKDRRSARHKKIKRTWNHYKPITGVLSGSISTRSFGDFWSPLRWALGSAAPLPLDLRSFLSWCYSLDEKVPDAARLHPGPLVDLTPAHELPAQAYNADGSAAWNDWERAQWAFGRRFISAPGVISTKDDVPPFGLQIEVTHVAAPAPVALAIRELRRLWETPDGNAFEHAFELWARERWMSRGGWFCWDPPPPDEWRVARKAKNAFVREAIQQHRKILDQPSQVEDAVLAGRIDDHGVFAWWRSVEPTYDDKDKSVWRWLPAGSYALIDDAINWLRGQPRHGIVWVHQTPIGEAVARAAGVPYYGEESRDRLTGQHIMEATSSCVASIRSCGTGKNLQHEFAWNYFLELPYTGKQMEQTVGRTHRDFQSVSDTVYVRIPVMCEGDIRILDQLLADAARIERTEQIPQKLIYGTWYGFDLARKQDLL